MLRSATLDDDGPSMFLNQLFRTFDLDTHSLISIPVHLYATRIGALLLVSHTIHTLTRITFHSNGASQHQHRLLGSRHLSSGQRHDCSRDRGRDNTGLGR